MSTIELLDALAKSDLGPHVPDKVRLTRRLTLLHEMINSTLGDLRRIEEFEQMLLDASAGLPLTMEMRDSVWRLFTAWVEEAVQIRVRAQTLVDQGAFVSTLSQLENALGRTRAKLSLTPSQISAAIEQVNQGKFTPIKEMRNELGARLRP